MWQLVVLCSLIALAAAWVNYRRSRYYKLMSVIPGPPGLPLIGNTIEANSNIGRILDYFGDVRQRYGNTTALWSGTYSGVLLCDPRDIEIVLTNTATLSKSMPYNVPALFLGYSLLTARRNDWKRYHKITSPAFSNVTLQSFLPAFNRKSRVLVDVLGKHGSGQSFDVLKYMLMCTLDIVTETSLGASMGILQDNREELVNGLKTAEDIVYHAIIQPWYWSHTLMKRTSSYKAMVRGIQALWDFAGKIVTQKMSNLTIDEASDQDILSEKDDDQLLGVKTKRMGFLDHVISCLKTDSILLTKTELHDNTMTVIAGGTDTGAIVMSAALMLLGLHQDVQKKVMEELDSIFGDDINRPVTVEDLKQMVYLEQVINETLRLYPPLPLVSRAVEEDIDITGYTLPAGSILMISPYLVHRSETNFPDPDKFDPDRFSAENSVGRHPYSFIPFLRGRRMCPGKNYAYMQMKTILSTVLRHYQVLPCGSREEMEKVQFRLTLHIVSGSNIKLATRNRT